MLSRVVIPPAISAGTQSVSTGTVVYSNSNNVTFGMTNSSIVTASASFAQTNQSAIRALGVSNTGVTAGNTGVSTGIDWVLAGSQSLTLSQSTAGGGGDSTRPIALRQDPRRMPERARFPLRIDRDPDRRDEPKPVRTHPTKDTAIRLPRWLATGHATVTLLPPGQRVANAGAIALPRMMLASDGMTRTVEVAGDAVAIPRVRVAPLAVGHWDMAAIAAADEAFLESMILNGDSGE